MACPSPAPHASLRARLARRSVLGAAALSAFLVLEPVREARPQEFENKVLNAMVQIVATRDGETLRGSGFIVSLDRERSIAYVLTSSHVIEGARFEATFAADLSQSSVPTEVIGLEAENRNGLAVFRVRSAVPPGAISLDIAGRNDLGPQPAQNLTLVGYPNASATPLVRTRTFSGQSGALYLVDLGVGEGSSGGPVLLDRKVVGLVTATTAEQTYVVPFATIRTFLEGYRVPFKPDPSAEPPGGGAGTLRPKDPAAPEGVTPEPPATGGKLRGTGAVAASGSFGAMVSVTGTVKGAAVHASGFVVTIHRQRGASYIVTSGQLYDAADLLVTFAADRSHPLPAHWKAKTTSSSGDGLLVLMVDSGVPESATLIELAESVSAAPRPVALVAGPAGAAPPQVLERQYLGPDAAAPFMFNIDGSVGPEFLGGPVLFDGKAGGMLVRIDGTRARAFAASEIRVLLSTETLYGQPALPKK